MTTERHVRPTMHNPWTPIYRLLEEHDANLVLLAMFVRCLAGAVELQLGVERTQEIARTVAAQLEKELKTAAPDEDHVRLILGFKETKAT